MGQITFVEHDGTQHSVEIVAGQSLMQTAVDNMVPGIDGDCGGACACGTCHVVVEDNWVSQTGTAGEDETQMLDINPEKSAHSRLACQIQLSDALDGLVVHVPEFQM